MRNNPDSEDSRESSPRREAIDHLRASLEQGRDWPTALLEAMALWTTPQETFRDRHFSYFIGGEAFDWLLLAERLCQAVDGLIPEQERETLLFTGGLPDTFDDARFSDLIGVDKYRGYLNYFYGVTVEEALQLAVEREVHKRHLSNGNRYQDDFSEEACLRIYRAPKDTLLKRFREERGSPCESTMTLTESKEFTYWLFKYRLATSDKAKTASDTKRGLHQLRRMTSTSRTTASRHLGD